MHVRAFVGSFRIKKTLNGFVYVRKLRLQTVPLERTKFVVDLPMGGTHVPVHGDFALSVAEAKKMVDGPCSFLIEERRRIRILGDCERPFYKIFVLEGTQTVPRGGFTIRIVRSLAPAPLWTDSLSLVKLTLCNIFLPGIDLRDQLRLRHVRIHNVGLESVILGPQALESCDLSWNRLRGCCVRAKSLDLSHNRIRILVSEHHYRSLNVSMNPLFALRCDSDVLYIKKTRIRHPVRSSARKIVADGTKNVRLGRCPHLKTLHVNDCHLKAIPPHLKGLKCLKARNNFLQDLPALPCLEYADLTGNFLTDLNVSSIKGVNLSKNNLNSFCAQKYPSLLWADLSFTTIDRIGCDERIKTRLNDVLFKKLKLLGPRADPLHCCRRKKQYLVKYTLKTTLKNRPATLFIIHCTKNREDLTGHLEALLRSHVCDAPPLSLLNHLGPKFSQFFTLLDGASKSALVLVTEQTVLIRSSGLEVVFANFAEVGRVSRSNETRVFVNTSIWYVFPVFCFLRRGSEERCYKLDRRLTDLKEIFQFLDFYCPLSVEFIIKNSLELTSETPGYARLSLRVYGHAYSKTFRQVYRDHKASKNDNRVQILGYGNIDFNMGFYRDHHLSHFITTSYPVFVFLRFYYNCSMNPLLASERLNIINVVHFLTKVFTGRFIEKNHQFSIIGFDNPISSALWGLRIQEILRVANIDVGIGITEDIVFRSEEGSQVLFGGPAFNKLSRMVDLGVGIFISEFLNISHPLIELVDEGDRQFKGFKNKNKIFSVHLKQRFAA